MCPFGIDKLRQYPAEILLLRSHGEHNTFGAHVPVKSLHLWNGETQFDSTCWVLVGSRVQRERGLARYKLAPPRRLELELETHHIAVELHCFAHVGDELDHVPKLRSLHLPPPLDE